MAGIKLQKTLFNRKIEASTLVEVLIALVIIMAVFVTGMAIFVNVTGSAVSQSKLKARERMSTLIQESISANDWDNKDFTEGDIFYSKTVSAYGSYPDLFIIEVEARQNETNLGELKRVVKKEINEN